MLLRFVGLLEVSVKETLKSLAVTSFVAVDLGENRVKKLAVYGFGNFMNSPMSLWKMEASTNFYRRTLCRQQNQRVYTSFQMVCGAVVLLYLKLMTI